MFPHELISTRLDSLSQSTVFGSTNCGLADDDFDIRFGFVMALVFVMNSWKGDKPAILAGDHFDLQLSPDGAMELEKVVAKYYYCQ